MTALRPGDASTEEGRRSIEDVRVSTTAAEYSLAVPLGQRALPGAKRTSGE